MKLPHIVFDFDIFVYFRLAPAKMVCSSMGNASAASTSLELLAIKVYTTSNQCFDLLDVPRCSRPTRWFSLVLLQCLEFQYYTGLYSAKQS